MRKQSLILFTSIILIVLFVVLFITLSNNKHSNYISIRKLSDEIFHQHHKDLIPFDTSDYWGSLFVVLGLLVAASGGIGGGGILVPLFILIFGFSPKYAIPLSNFTIVGSSITNMLLNIPKRHPLADRPLVDWDLILVMEPITMVGAIIGAFVSKVLPDWILVIALVILLAYTTQTTLTKGISQFEKETKYFNDLKKSQLSKAIEDENESEESQSLINKEEIVQEAIEVINEIETFKDIYPTGLPKIYQGLDPALVSLIDEEKKTPWDKVNIITFMVVIVVILNLVKGGNSSHTSTSPLGITCGSSGYWLITIITIVFVFGISVWMREILINKWKLKKQLNYRYLEGDVEWNSTNTIIYPFICFFAGFSAGLFGVGGGIIKGPLMLQMGVHPLVASATVAVMIMYTSVAATTMYIAFGTLTWDYAIYMFILGLLATCIGQFGVSYLVEKYKRVSLVSLSIGAVVALSTLLMGIQSVFNLTDKNSNIESSTLCSK